MGELGALFNPGMRHELEERRAKAARREEEGNARDGDLRIDLESGVAVINAPGDEPDGERSGSASTDSTPSGAAGSEPAGSDPAGSDPAGPDGDEGRGTEPAAADSKPAPLRPRGKRALSAGRR